MVSSGKWRPVDTCPHGTILESQLQIAHLCIRKTNYRLSALEVLRSKRLSCSHSLPQMYRTSGVRQEAKLLHEGEIQVSTI